MVPDVKLASCCGGRGKLSCPTRGDKQPTSASARRLQRHLPAELLAEQRGMCRVGDNDHTRMGYQESLQFRQLVDRETAYLSRLETKRRRVIRSSKESHRQRLLSIQFLQIGRIGTDRTILGQVRYELMEGERHHDHRDRSGNGPIGRSYSPMATPNHAVNAPGERTQQHQPEDGPFDQ